jgi:hypothetical protein
VPYLKEAAVIFTFYTTGVLIFAYLAYFHITDTEYFKGEEDVIIPKHILEEHPHPHPHPLEARSGSGSAAGAGGEAKEGVEDQTVTIAAEKNMA